ncbi:MAG: multicopper oxidase family protein [Caldilinea sp. CFX5]|nr:multicopper oxidase family protein [Caldilinea sp. CFX5]
MVQVALAAQETTWEYAPGRVVSGYGFNGQIPGPVIEARQGVPLAIQLTNNLPEPTIVHWHGLRVPAAMDGTEHVQQPVQPGESFTYRFTPPDAGTFWYHPHTNETVQLEKGLYGALIVRGADEPTLDGEQILVLDDLKLNWWGKVAGFGNLLDRHNGREGEVRLVNGKAEPDLTIAAGQIERWRVINASSARYVRLAIGGKPFRILGTDGGLIEAPVAATEVLLAAADRVDLAVGPFTEGEVLAVEALPYNRGTGHRKSERFATLKVGAAKPSVAVIPEHLRTIDPLVTGPVTPSRTVKLSGRMSLRRGFDFLINDETHHHAEPVKVGDLQVWDIVNVAPIDHPFHLHGFFFQVLAINGEPPAWRSWEDVVNVPAKSTVRIAWLPDDRPGSWMYHCHILEHHAAGMMAHFAVVR